MSLLRTSLESAAPRTSKKAGALPTSQRISSGGSNDALADVSGVALAEELHWHPQDVAPELEIATFDSNRNNECC